MASLSPHPLWRMEQQFWLGDAAFHAQHLAPGALMVVPPPVGVLDRAGTLASIRGVLRWETVRFDDQVLADDGTGVVVLAYRAHASRGAPGGAYAALCSSTYVRHQDQWLLALHHQTPLP